ncbi:MAG: cell division protein ZapE [Pseudomonadota bacterium]
MTSQGNNSDFRAHYLTELDRRGYVADAAQLKAVEVLAGRARALRKRHRPGLVGRWLGRSPRLVRGVYFWGGVGRGKTFIMDLFYEWLPIDDKHRSHFHRFMRWVHDQLADRPGESDPLDAIAADFAAEHRVLCLDEFFVSDITDAMLLGRLLASLFEHGVTLITTSNAAPGELYRDGLQRTRFLPAIELLETRCEVVNLDAGTDYRLELLAQSQTYLDANDARTAGRLALYFDRLAPGRYTTGESIDIENRPIATVRRGKSIAWFTFAALCQGPRSQNDYIAIARQFQTVIVSGVPVLDAKTDDEARRFIALIDEFYDRRIKLVLSAAAPADRLYVGQRLAFEFERTVSRLSEMQSTSYLASPHRP